MTPRSRSVQKLGVMRDVLTHERRDEIVRMVVASLHAERYGLLRLQARLLEDQRLQLIDVPNQETVDGALVAKDVEVGTVVRLDQLRCIILLPGGLVLSEVQLEGLLAPGTVHGIADRGKSRNGDVLVGILQADGEGAVAAHAVPEDRLLVGHGEISGNHLRELGHDEVVHVVVLLVLLRRGRQVEAGSNAEIVYLRILVWNTLTTRGSVRQHQDHLIVACRLEGACLLGEVQIAASEAGKPVHSGQLLPRGDVREVHGEDGAGATQLRGCELDAPERALSDTDLVLHCDRHVHSQKLR
mmetsp:Transcript_3613/g.9863  ORF Transcript_3613/g.9863 Transcript_3613/m.9863 type:complete len:299 (+) Transcript_3613:100-996(+)